MKDNMERSSVNERPLAAVPHSHSALNSDNERPNRREFCFSLSRASFTEFTCDACGTMVVVV